MPYTPLSSEEPVWIWCLFIFGSTGTSVGALTSIRRFATMTLPEVGGSRPAIRFNNVDFPLPDRGPGMVEERDKDSTPTMSRGQALGLSPGGRQYGRLPPPALQRIPLRFEHG